MNPTRIIRLAQSTPLPCSTYDLAKEAPCGKPATAAYASELEEPPNSPMSGRWIIKPVCSECATAARKEYEL